MSVDALHDLEQLSLDAADAAAVLRIRIVGQDRVAAVGVARPNRAGLTTGDIEVISFQELKLVAVSAPILRLTSFSLDF